MKKLLQSLFVLMLFAFSAVAQQRTITGTVTGKDDGQPLPGVSIQIKGASGGTSTNAAGKYTLTIPSAGTALEFSSLGYLSQSVSLSSGNVVNVSLAPDEKALTEVVVVGYGTQVRKDITGSVGSVKGEALKNLATPSFDKQLAGQVTGVQAAATSGILGEPARIRIRGTNSISSSGEPLYVVDGVPYIAGDRGTVIAYNPLGDINPNDIESFDVLKDGAATAIYGSRAANGVILITTKRGKTGQAKLTYDSWFALATPSKRYDLLNAEQFIEIANEKYAYYDEAAKAFPTLNADGSVLNTDWQDVILRNGFQQNHSLSVSGATEQTNYYVSLGFADMEGTTVTNNLRKYNLRTKLEQKAFNNRVTFGINSAVSYSLNNALNDGAGAANLSGNIASALRALPNVPVKNADGTYHLSQGNTTLGPGTNAKAIDDNYPNIGYIIENNVYKTQALNLTGNAFVKVNLFDGLDATSQIGVNYINVEDYMYWNALHGDGRGSNGIVDQYYTPTFRYNWQNTLNYSKIFGDHKLDMVAGLEFQKTRDRFINASGTSLSAKYFAEGGNIISNSFANQFYGGGAYESAYTSMFGRVSYAYLDKYLLSAAIRQDKISDLPIGNQEVTLPGASIGWRISEEAFMANSSFINDFKIRGGFAKVGNVEIGKHIAVGIFDPVQYGDASGIKFNRLGNPSLLFETSNKMNVGVDATLFNNSVSFSVDYFKNEIDNLILATPTPSSYGVPGNTYSANVGSMNNKGWEFSLSTTNVQNDSFTWTTNFNLTFVKNKITALANENADLINTYNVTRVGESIGTFYGYESAGVNPANGNPLWYKADGSIVQGDIDTYRYFLYNASNPADMSTAALAITGSDKRILGQANPTWFGGFNNTFKYKAFDLGVMFTFSGGNKVYNVTRQEALNNLKFLNNGVEVLDRWTTPGQITNVPKLAYGDDNHVLQNGNLNSRFLEDGKFIRAQNISLGYSIAPKLLNKLHINSLRIYGQVQNAFVITNYTGLDPELSSATTSNRAPGVDWNTNPIPRTVMLGINVGF